MFFFKNVLARTDDVINVAGHRLSTGALEEVLSSHSAIAEAATGRQPSLLVLPCPFLTSLARRLSGSRQWRLSHRETAF